MSTVLLLAALTGCGGGDATTEDGSSDVAVVAVTDSWIAETATNPAAFAALLEAGKEGWVKLHANDYKGSVEAFEEAGSPALMRARPEWQLAMLYGDLARLQGNVHKQLFETWDRRVGVPLDSQAPAVAFFAQYCAGDTKDHTWAVKMKPDAQGRKVADLIMRGKKPWDVDIKGKDDPWISLFQRHRDARRGDLTALMRFADKPVVVEKVEATDKAKEFERTFHDPCLHATLHDAWLKKATRSLGGSSWIAAGNWGKEVTGLEGRLFAPWPNSDDLLTEVKRAKHPGTLGANSPSLNQHGVGKTPSARDNVQAARAEARALDTLLDAQRKRLLATAGADGAALLTDLRLTQRFRQEWLVARAREALLGGRPRQALAYLELAWDVSDRSIGPNNSPAVLALTAEARLRLGRTREALDALQTLTQAYPEVVGLREVTGDLAVLQGLDRQGDSKEN